MHKRYYSFLPIILLVLFGKFSASACGYDWIGECSSNIHLRINGTLDSFDIADCPSGFQFQGQYLGNLQYLSLANARAITWESCINNVTAVNLKYRVYEQGGSGGGFQTLGLDQDYFTILGPYTTRYRSKASNIDLTAGLMVGKTYILEVYLVADVDTIGDDFIPETTLTKNNGGQNYQLSFTYGGPQAPPFVVIPTRVKQPNCHGESNGIIGVSVWGDQSGLFYHWSNVNLNFYQQNGLAAGTYSVTVTGANYSDSTTILLEQPALLTLQTSNLQPVSCGGGLGAITVTPQGGTAPYHYAWQNGQTTATATFQSGGNYSVSVTDAHNCPLAQTIQIPATGLIQASRQTSICTGQSIMIGTTFIDKGGEYEIPLPGLSGCDTLLHLTVTEHNPGVLLSSLPSNIQITCASPSVNLCANSSSGATYQWSKDGIPATQTPCLLATAGGIYTLSVQLEGCMASKMIQSEEHLTSPIVSLAGVLTYIMDCYEVDSTILTCFASFSGPGAHYEWTFQGQTISTSDTCILRFDGSANQISVPVLTVTDQYGCHTTKQPLVSVTFPPMAPSLGLVDFDPDWCTGLELVDYYVFSDNEDITVSWNDSVNTGNSILLPPGTYQVKMTNAAGCATEQTIQVPPVFYATVMESPFPDINTGFIDIETSGPASFHWDDGSTSSSRYSLAPGQYCVTISDWQQVCSLDTCFLVAGSVGTSELSGSMIHIAPNPVPPGACLKIELPAGFSRSDLQVEMTDMQGKKILSTRVNLVNESLQLQVAATLTPGIYWIRIRNAQAQWIEKLCVQK